MDDPNVPPPLAGEGQGEGSAPVTPEEAAPRGLLILLSRKRLGPAA